MSNNKQSSVDKEFVPYTEALALKELGFDEPCLKYNWNDAEASLWMSHSSKPKCFHTQDFWTENDLFTISIPTYSQCFKWFREKHDLFIAIVHYVNGYSINDLRRFETFEEAELECLKELIKIQAGNDEQQ